jgi:N-acetylneuraminic acid mutarotase
VAHALRSLPALVLAAISLGAGSVRAGSATPWSPRAPLGEPRQEVGVAALGGRVWVVGGFAAGGSTADTVEVYDPAADRWTAVASLPRRLHHAAAVAVGTKIYVIGGHTGALFAPVDSVFAYDPDSDTWTERASMPTARGALAAAVIDGKVYAAGGSPAARERDFAVYDPVEDAWTVLPDLPTARNHLAAGAIGGRFYAVGGRSGSIGGITPALEEFDPAARTWTARSPLPTARGGIAAAVVQDRLLVLGGEGNPSTATGVFPEVEAYDPATDTWTALTPMRTPRHGIGAAVVAGLVHVPGGATLQGFGVTGVHEVFDPALDPGLARCDAAGVGPGDPCDDGDPCTAGDTCTAGRCAGTRLTCFEGARCRFASPVAGAECPDGLVARVNTRARRAARKLESAGRRAAAGRVAGAERLLRQARRRLDAAQRAVGRAVERGSITDACSFPLTAALGERRAGIDAVVVGDCVGT